MLQSCNQYACVINVRLLPSKRKTCPLLCSSWVSCQKNNNLVYERYHRICHCVVIFEGCLGWDLDVSQGDAAGAGEGWALSASRAMGWGEKVGPAGYPFGLMSFPPMLAQDIPWAVTVRSFSPIAHPTGWYFQDVLLCVAGRAAHVLFGLSCM